MSSHRLDEVIAELRNLSEQVPRPPGLPTEAQVRRVEDEVGIHFHDDFRRYLLEASDVVYGSVEPVTIGRGGHTDFVAVLEAARASGVPEGTVPVCEDNGDFFCVAPSGEVVYWSHNGSTSESWPDLATWMHEVWISGR